MKNNTSAFAKIVNYLKAKFARKKEDTTQIETTPKKPNKSDVMWTKEYNEELFAQAREQVFKRKMMKIEQSNAMTTLNPFDPHIGLDRVDYDSLYDTNPYEVDDNNINRFNDNDDCM